MEQQVEALRGEALAEIAAAKDRATLEAARIRYLGKSGAVTAISEGMRNVPKEDRPRFGKLLNDLRQAVTQALDDSERLLLEAADSAAVSSLDLSLPGTWPSPGTLHPLTQLMDRAVRCFRRMGFAIADGPDIETEWHCFDALNTPPDHPARNEQDTFYLPDGRLLRSHTSSVQIRVMENTPPPVRIIAPGSAYRRDEVDATHLAQFTQMEGLYVAERVSLADLKGTLEFFFRELSERAPKSNSVPTFSRSPNPATRSTSAPPRWVVSGWNSPAAAWSIPPSLRKFARNAATAPTILKKSPASRSASASSASP